MELVVMYINTLILLFKQENQLLKKQIITKKNEKHK